MPPPTSCYSDLGSFADLVATAALGSASFEPVAHFPCLYVVVSLSIVLFVMDHRQPEPDFEQLELGSFAVIAVGLFVVAAKWLVERFEQPAFERNFVIVVE